MHQDNVPGVPDTVRLVGYPARVQRFGVASRGNKRCTVYASYPLHFSELNNSDVIIGGHLGSSAPAIYNLLDHIYGSYPPNFHRAGQKKDN